MLAENAEGELVNVLFMDSEGFSSCNEKHDQRLTVIALLISTAFLYNSRGAIDKQSLMELAYLIEIAAQLRRTTSMNAKPEFCWILRDFYFELVNELGLPITSN